MPPRNKVKLGLTIPANPRSNSRTSFDASSFGNSPLTSPCATRSAPPSALPSPSRRVPRSPSSVRPIPPPPPPAPAKKKADAAKLEGEDTENVATSFGDNTRMLAKQLSMRETSTARDIAWEKRRRQNIRKERRRYSVSGTTPTEEPSQPTAAACAEDGERITDADLHDLKGSIELGFGFNEEEGQKLCNTLPALDLYFAVNRTFSPKPVSAPHPPPMPLIKIPSAPMIMAQSMSPLNSPRSDQDSWKIGSPATWDDPQQVKIKLRHWAQAVACSIIQSS